MRFFITRTFPIRPLPHTLLPACHARMNLRSHLLFSHHASAFFTSLIICCCTLTASAFDLLWMLGSHNDNALIIDGHPITPTSFNATYELRLMHLGANPTPHVSRGYPTFLHVDTAQTLDPSIYPNYEGRAEGILSLETPEDYQGSFFLMVLYNKSSHQYFTVSETPGGSSIDPFYFEYDAMDAILFPWMINNEYFPASSTGAFYIGTSIPAFCGWLSQFNLTEDDLSALDPTQVNLAYALNQNPNIVSTPHLSWTQVTTSSTHWIGHFSLTITSASSPTPSPVTRILPPAALTVLTSPSLEDPFTSLPLTLNPTNGVVQIPLSDPSSHPSSPTNQFFKLKLSVPSVW